MTKKCLILSLNVYDEEKMQSVVMKRSFFQNHVSKPFKRFASDHGLNLGHTSYMSIARKSYGHIDLNNLAG